MAQTSVHLKACDISASEAHNKREKELGYVRKDLTHLNESFSFIPHSLQTELANIKREVKEKTKRKLQKNAVPIKEGVIVINDRTTMEDLKKFCEECKNKFGIIPLQIHIHRDEGHTLKSCQDFKHTLEESSSLENPKWKPNLHAHIVWRMYDLEGRNVRMSKDDCRELQTIAANVLHMERGVSSDRKHLSALQFKIEKEAERLKKLAQEVDGKTKAKEMLKGAKEGVSDLFTGKARQKTKDAEKRAEEAEKRERQVIEKTKEVLIQAETLIEQERTKRTKAEKQAEQIRQEWAGHQEELKSIAKIKQEAMNTKTLLEDAVSLGLTAKQVLELTDKKVMNVERINTHDGISIARADGQPIKLKYEKGGIYAYLACSWERAKSWVRMALRSPWFRTNQRRQGKGRTL